MRAASPFSMIGVPIDCSGRTIGVERMPAALRAAGLVERLGIADAGDLPVTLNDPQRDPASGMIAFQQVCAVSADIRTGVGELLAQGKRPLVVGGCCTLLIGVAAALRDHIGAVGLAFVDGHLDYYTGQSSPTGEAADMELAILTGLGPAGLVDLVGPPPLLPPAEVVVLGHRDAAQASEEGAPDPHPAIALYDARRVKQMPAALGRQVAARFEASPGRFWFHLDLDVLDETVLPAVDYLMPDGLTWAELAALIAPLAQSPALVGVDVTIYNPTLDPDGSQAKRIVDFLADFF